MKQISALPWRLIPAHAGKTGFIVNGQTDHWAHPRSRGENAGSPRPGGLAYGSSPLTRGKPGLRGHEYFMTGLIPAHAGKTARSPLDRALTWAHPRSRGENQFTAIHSTS